MSTIGIILARGGSKRLPGKNVRPLAGIPMVGWTILAGQASRELSSLVVSTDDDRVLKMARACGIEKIRRPEHLANDSSSPYDAIRHAYEQIGTPFDFICLLQPTSPLRTWEDIDICVRMARNVETPAVVSHERGCIKPNGAVYVGQTEWLLSGGNFDIGPATPYYMPAERSVDVDTLDDFNKAQAIMLGKRLAA